MNKIIVKRGGGNPFFIFFILIVLTALILPVSASQFGLGSRTNQLGIKNYYINQSFITVANGSDIFVFRSGDQMTGTLNITGTTSQLTINRNAAALGPSTILGTALRINCADGETCRMGITSYGTGATNSYSCRNARGTSSSPTASQTGDLLGQFDAYGRSNSSWTLTPRAMLKIFTSEVYNDTQQGAYISLYTTKKGTVVPSESMRIDDGQTSVIGNLSVNGNFAVTGNFSAKRPYGMYSSNQTQTMVSANTPYVVSFNNVEDDYEIIKSDNSNFTVLQPGDYLIEVSAIFTVDTPNAKVELWLQKNGANVLRSNTIMTLPSSSTEIPLAVPFIVDLNTTDKIRIMIATNNGGAQMLYVTNTSYSPETPSIIMTMSKISEITP